MQIEVQEQKQKHKIFKRSIKHQYSKHTTSCTNKLQVQAKWTRNEERKKEKSNQIKSNQINWRFKFKTITQDVLSLLPFP